MVLIYTRLVLLLLVVIFLLQVVDLDGIDIHTSSSNVDYHRQMLLSKATNNTRECIHVATGLYSVEHIVHMETTILTINNIADLSCICTTVENHIGRIYEEQFLNVRGAMLHNDCGALRFLTKLAVSEWKHNPSRNKAEFFVYVETGSYLGLSSHVVVSSAQEERVPLIAYAHDIFDNSETDLWLFTQINNKTNLEKFYDNVRSNGLQRSIIPIAGYSHITLRMHPSESVDMVFVDGDHSFEGALRDFREAWRILQPGGFMVGHDCLPEDNDVIHVGMGANGVRKALRVFLREAGVAFYDPIRESNSWWIVNYTAYMFLIRK